MGWQATGQWGVGRSEAEETLGGLLESLETMTTELLVPTTGINDNIK